MLERIKRRLSGAAHPADAERKCRVWIANFLTNLRSQPIASEEIATLVAHLDDRSFYDAVLKFLSDACRQCFTTSDKKAQLINLRRQIVENADHLFEAEVYLSKNTEDRQILTDRRYNDRTKVENDLRFAIRKSFNYTATVLLRFLGNTYFGDMSVGDWFDAYSKIGRHLVQTQLDAAVYASKGEAHLAGVMLPSLEARLNEIKEVAFSGGSMHLPTSDSPPAEEAPKKPVARRDAIYEDEKDRLVDLFSSRLNAVSHGRVYKLDEFEPHSTFRCAIIDAALLWTALGIKLEESRKAKSYVIEIVGRAFERWGVDTNDETQFATLVSEAEALAEHQINADRAGEQWLASFLVTAFAYVYDVAIDSSPAKKERSREIGRTAFGLGAHVWPLYADVLTTLGEPTSRTWLGSEDQKPGS